MEKIKHYARENIAYWSKRASGYSDVNQQELGHLAGVSRQTISLIERGDYSPSVTLALKLAKICHARVEYIFILEEDGPHEES